MSTKRIPRSRTAGHHVGAAADGANSPAGSIGGLGQSDHRELDYDPIIVSPRVSSRDRLVKSFKPYRYGMSPLSLRPNL